MAEEFAVDGALGDGAAVDGEIVAAPAGRLVVYEAGYNLLAHTAFAHDEHRQVGAGHLQGYVQRMVQRIAVAHDVVASFDGLKVYRIHNRDKITYFS